MRQHSPALIAAALLLALGPAPGQAPADTDVRSCFDDSLRLRPPTGWEMQAEAERVLLNRPDGAPIEVISWPIPKGAEPSGRAAAAAHESTLFEQAPYRRVTVKPLIAAGGLEGLLVSGLTLQEGNQTTLTSFAAFASAGRYYIFGTTTAAEAGDTAAQALKLAVAGTEFVAPQPVVIAVAPPPPPPTADTPGATAPVETSRPATGPASVRPTTPPAVPGEAPLGPEPPKPLPAPEPLGPVAPPPAPGPALPAPVPATPPTLPVTVPAPAAPVPTVPIPIVPAVPPAPAPDVTPVTPPPVRESTPAPPAADWTRFKSPLGFALEHPPGWNVTLVGGHIEVTAPPDAGATAPAAGAIIWPITQVAPGADPAALARALLAGSPLVGTRAADLRPRQTDGLAILAGNVGPEQAPRQLVAACHLLRDQGLVTALLARPEEFATRLPDLLRVLASFEGGPWWADTSEGAAQATNWQDAGEGRLRLPLPDGWKAEGQVRSMADLWSVSVDPTNEAQHLRCSWRQPVQPLYRDLTPVLRNLGWQEGDRYPANVKDCQLKILGRLNAQDYLTRHWLPEGPHRLSDVVLDQVTVLPAVGELAGSGNASGVVAVLHGQSAAGPRQRICVVATADVAPGGEPNCWQAAVLEAEGPAGSAGEAVAVLRAALDGAIVSEPATATTISLRGMVQAARMALDAAPGQPGPRLEYVDVLTIRNTEARGRLWLLSPAALAPWQQARQALARGDSVAAVAPELGADYWK